MYSLGHGCMCTFDGFQKVANESGRSNGIEIERFLKTSKFQTSNGDISFVLFAIQISSALLY